MTRKGRRSDAWFRGVRKNAFMHRSWMKNQGFPADVFDRPVIGICNTWSELTPCNSNLRELAEWVRRGVYEAGGLPLEFPVTSLGESNMRPTAMLYRNLASMDVEETIRSNPLDGVVLLAGCDKTTPALLMGAASCDLPTILLSTGPMSTSRFHGRPIGSGTDVWRLHEEVRAGTLSLENFLEAEAAMNRTPGTCNVMGTASTMACLSEALGVSLPGNGALPAVDARRRVLAQLTGRRAVELVRQDCMLSRILTKEAFENAIRLNAAIGGSTNAVIHLIAIAGRVGVNLTLEDWNRCGKSVPTIVNLMPSGRYLMEDFFFAGGVPVVQKALLDIGLWNMEVATVGGQATIDAIANATNYDSDVIKPVTSPLTEDGGIAVLRGNLAPQGAVLKPSAASPELLRHKGRAVVFESIEDYHERINDPELNVTPNSILVLKNCGPRGYPGMAEVGNMGLPSTLLQKGVRDMVRISDARMSGTAYGTVVLHVAPEAAVGGPLALVRDGDEIVLDVPGRSLELRVSDEELALRKSGWEPPPFPANGGYQALFAGSVLQADRGCDFDFLVGRRGAAIPRDSH